MMFLPMLEKKLALDCSCVDGTCGVGYLAKNWHTIDGRHIMEESFETLYQHYKQCSLCYEFVLIS
jgi:hypothetical protein